MPCVLSSTLSTALHEAYLKEASLPHPTRGDMEEVTTLAQPEAFKKYLDEVAGTSCSPDTDTNGSEHGQENGNGVSSEILNSVENDESSNHSSGSKRRKALRRQREEDEPSQRKSTRRAGDVVETNYVDSLDLKQPRSVQPPTGTTRVPFNSPKQGAEDKQMERLRINMVGPRTRETGTTTVDAADKVRRRVIGINEGSDYQASVVPVEEFRMPTKAEMDAYPDRDDESVNLMWRDKPSLDAQLLEEAWVAIRKQSAGMIPIDAMLHRLLLCNYNVDKMLQTIELEHQNLPQPFEQLSVGQRKEYERWLRKTGNASAKKFRMMQDKFMKTYWLGEIVNYYYSTKKKGCPTVEYNLCTCRSQCDVEDRGRVTRVECSNCTQYIWGQKRRVPNKLCAVCYLYQRRNNEPRRCPKLSEDEEKIASFWKEMDEIGSRHRTLSQVLEKMEKERKDLYVENARLNPEECPVVSGKKTSRLTPEDMADLAAKYRVTPQQNCVILSPQMSTIRAASLVKFTPQETMKTVEGLLKYGKKWATVACHVGTKEAVEVEYFYKANCRKYRLDVLTNPNAPPASPLSAKDKEKEKEKERSGTPESRKRKADVDPPYKGDAGVTPQKTSRKTRRSGVGGSERTPPIEMNHSQPVEAL